MKKKAPLEKEIDSPIVEIIKAKRDSNFEHRKKIAQTEHDEQLYQSRVGLEEFNYAF